MRNLVPVLVELTALPFQETYWTCSLVFPDGETVRVAGSEITIAGDKFQGGLITVSGLRASLGNSVDRIDITVENVDWKWTKRAQIQRETRKRGRIVGRAIRPIRGGDWAFLSLLNGVLVSITSTEKEATLSCIADLVRGPGDRRLDAIRAALSIQISRSANLRVPPGAGRRNRSVPDL